MSITSTVPSYTEDLPKRVGQSQAEFDTNVNNKLNYDVTLAPAINTVAGEMNTLSSEFNTTAADAITATAESEANAQTSATAAANSAVAVGSVSGAVAYNSGTTYAQYDHCYGLTNGLLYRCLVGGTSGTDPEDGDITIWLPVEVLRLQPVTKAADFTFNNIEAAYIDCSSSSIAGTTPTNPGVGDKITFSDLDETFDDNSFELKYNGTDKIMGLSESMFFDYAITNMVTLMYINSTIGWRLI